MFMKTMKHRIVTSDQPDEFDNLLRTELSAIEAGKIVNVQFSTTALPKGDDYITVFSALILYKE